METPGAGDSRQERDALIRELAGKASEDPQPREDLARLVRETVEPHVRRCLGERLAHAVDDACQEVWLAVQGRLESIWDPDNPCYVQSPVTWLRGVAANQARSQRRQERGTVLWSTLDRAEVPDPSILGANGEGGVAIEEILQRLGETDRRIVDLKMAGCSVEEITSELHISKEQYVRRMRRIRQELGDLLPDATAVARRRRGVSAEP